MWLLLYLDKMQKEISWKVKALKNHQAEKVNRKILMKDQFSYAYKLYFLKSIWV